MRRIKSLGLGAVMALALLAVPAGASAAGGIETTETTKPTVLQASNVGNHEFYFPGHGEAGELSCQTMYLEALLEHRRSVVSSSLGDDCGGAGTTKIEPNGCEFELSAGSGNSLGIGPAGCGPMKVTASGSLQCKVTIGAQSGLPATFTNVGSGSTAKVTVDLAIQSLGYTTAGGNAFCSNGIKRTDGEYHGKFEVKGFSAGGSQTGIKATDAFPLGFFINGEGSEEEVQQPKFNAEKYPATIQGKQDPKELFVFEAGNGEAYCKASESSLEISKPTATLQLVPSYGGCWGVFGSQVTVAMNSCHYVLDLVNSGPPYSGNYDFACDVSGDAIEIVFEIPIFADCTVTIPPQTPDGEVEYANLGGESTSVHMSATMDAVQFTTTGNKLCKQEFGSEATLSGGATLQGIW